MNHVLESKRSRVTLALATSVLGLSLVGACTPASSGSGTGGRGGSGSGGSGGSHASGGSGGGSGGAGGSHASGGSGGAGGSGDTGGTSGSSGSGGSSASGGSGGSGGSADTGGSGGSSEADASAPVDSAPAGDDASSTPDSGGAPGALTECSKPSIDRITWWQATGEGTTVPMKEGTSLLVKEGDAYVAKEEFKRDPNWSVLEVVISNNFDKTADLSTSTKFTLTYSTTADLWLQLRPGGNAYSGDMHWGIKIPSTGGQKKQMDFPLVQSSWGTIPGLEKPSVTFPQALKSATGFVFVSPDANMIAFYGLRFDHYTPTCP